MTNSIIWLSTTVAFRRRYPLRFRFLTSHRTVSPSVSTTMNKLNVLCFPRSEHIVVFAQIKLNNKNTMGKKASQILPNGKSTTSKYKIWNNGRWVRKFSPPPPYFRFVTISTATAPNHILMKTFSWVISKYSFYALTFSVFWKRYHWS